MISQFLIIFTLIIIFFISNFISKILKIPNIIFYSLFIWNIILTILYMIYVDRYGGDQIYYYFKYDNFDQFFATIKEGKSLFRPGRNFINILNIFLKTKLYLTYESVAFIFSSFGLIGTLFLFSSYRNFININKNQKNIENYSIVLILVFLPSLTFWTSSIGKDSITFLAISLSIYSVISYKFRFSFIFISVALALLVRPHIAFIIYISFYISLFFQKSNYKLISIILLSIPLIVFYEYAIVYSGYTFLNIFSLNEINQYLTQVYYKNYKLENTFLFSNKYLVLLIEPLFYNANNFYKIYISIENTILILLFLYLTFRINLNKVNFTKYNTTVLFISAVSITTLLALTVTSNAGIAVRQKWMAIPIIFSILLIFQNKQNEK